MLIRSRKRPSGLGCNQPFKVDHPSDPSQLMRGKNRSHSASRKKTSQPLMKHRAIHHSAPVHSARGRGFHSRCFDNVWVPAPARSTPRRSSKEKRRDSLPLCLVCDREDNSDPESIECLLNKFDRSVKRLEEMDEEVQRASQKQRAKVLHDLWKMDEMGQRPPRPESKSRDDSSFRIDSRRSQQTDADMERIHQNQNFTNQRPKSAKTHGQKSKQKLRLEIDTSRQSEDAERSWHELLENDRRQKKKQDIRSRGTSDENSLSGSPRNDEVDLDFVPAKDWSPQSFEDKRKKKEKSFDHRHTENIDADQIEIDRNYSEGDPNQIRNRRDFKKNRQKTFMRQASYEKEEVADYRNNLVESPGSYGGKDIIKEFVDLSFERDKEREETKKSSSKQEKKKQKEKMSTKEKRELAECLEQIDKQVPGKLIESKNLLDEDDQATNVSMSLSEEKCSTLRSEHGRHMTSQMINRQIREKTEAQNRTIRVQNQFRQDEDVFIEMIIDELKRENKDLKFALVAREEKLMDAAAKVREVVEENALLSKRYEKAIRRDHQLEAELKETQQSYDEKIFQMSARMKSFEDKMSVMNASKPNLQMSDFEEAVGALKKRLAESEAINENLKTYIDHLKKSYHSVFGPNYYSNSSPSSMSVNPLDN